MQMKQHCSAWVLSTMNKSLCRLSGLVKNVVDNAVARLDKSKGNMLFRIRAVANIIVGELAVCDIEMVDNQLIILTEP